MKLKVSKVALLIFVLLISSSCNNSTSKNNSETGIFKPESRPFTAKDLNQIIENSPNQLVNDYTGTLTDSEKNSLENYLVNWDNKTTNQLAVVLIPDLLGNSIDSVSLNLFNSWGIGRADKNNGLLILSSIKDRSIRISTGLGMEKIIPNERATQILNMQIIPELKKEKFYKGLFNGVSEIVRIVDSANGVPPHEPNTLLPKFP